MQPYNKISNELFQEACNLIPGGVNSPVRSFKAVGLKPIFISKAKGPYLWDVDGNQYIDFVNSWGALIHGHIPDEVIKEVQDALQKGTSFGAPHKMEIELAQIITNNFPSPSIEKVRLVNSGTEAVMTAIRLARAYTKRNKIIKFEGCYHGHSDAVLSMSGSGVATLDIPGSPGIPQSVVSETITVPFNNINATQAVFQKYEDEIAAVITEPVIGNSGVIKPQDNFLLHLRELTKKYHSLLIFDEVITGFRLSLGGAQQLFNITPDITTLGKIIGGGMPIGAVGGRKDIMDLLAPQGPVYQAGTLSGNPISVACGIATLKLIKKESYEHLDKLTLNLTSEMEKINKEEGIKAQINRIGSMFSIFFSDHKVYDYTSAKTSDTKIFANFFKNMLSCGIYLAPSQFEANFISLAHGEDEIKKTLTAYKKSIKSLR